jgi:hypothetical protein
MVVAKRLASGFLQAPGTSVLRGVRGNALVKASERHPKERQRVLDVNENNVRQNAYRQVSCRTLALGRAQNFSGSDFLLPRTLLSLKTLPRSRFLGRAPS